MHMIEPIAYFTGTISGNVLTVSAVTTPPTGYSAYYGPILPNYVLTGIGITWSGGTPPGFPGVVSQLSGKPGGVGTYQLDRFLTVATTTMYGRPPTNAVWVKSDGGSQFNHFEQWGSYDGYLAQPPKGQTVFAQFLSDDVWDTNALNNMMLDARLGGSIASIFCTPCWANWGGNTGLTAIGTAGTGLAGTVNGIDLMGGQYNNNSYQGIYLGPYVSNVTIHTKVQDNSFPTVGGLALGSAGIEIAGAKHVAIDGSIIGNSGQYGTIQKNSVNIDSASDYIGISGGDLSTFGTGGVAVNDTSSSPNNKVCGVLGAASNC